MACIVFVFCAATVIVSPAQTFTSLVSFDYTDGGFPYAGLVQGTDGNFYGTTLQGGDKGGYGTVFKITASGTLTTLHNFDDTDGNYPYGGLVLAIDGNFYGTTTDGGANGEGTVFKITPAGTLTTLHSFDLTDGAHPSAALVQGTDGNFYGTTSGGGTSSNCYEGCGTVFKITAGGTLTTLHSFDYTDGSFPFAALVQATDGNFYGTTVQGGASSNCPDLGCGTVFKITPVGTLTTLHNFDGSDGDYPSGGLVPATDGSLYGTTSDTVFKIAAGGILTTLDEVPSVVGLVQATDGNFYGTTYQEGAHGDGSVFKITAGGTLTTLYSFDVTEGGTPYDPPLQATDGNFYGTTSKGPFSSKCGACYGTVFSLSTGLGPFVSFISNSGIVGASAQILGQGFTGATSVSFNGTPAVFAVQSDTYLTATVPAGATSGRVTVTTPGGTLKSNQVFRVVPQIFSFSPTGGPVGTSVVITGESLTGATLVGFGGVPTTSFTVNSDTQITATAPTGARTGSVAVHTPGGNGSGPEPFTVTP